MTKKKTRVARLKFVNPREGKIYKSISEVIRSLRTRFLTIESTLLVELKKHLGKMRKIQWICKFTPSSTHASPRIHIMETVYVKETKHDILTYFQHIDTSSLCRLPLDTKVQIFNLFYQNGISSGTGNNWQPDKHKKKKKKKKETKNTLLNKVDSTISPATQARITTNDSQTDKQTTMVNFPFSLSLYPLKVSDRNQRKHPQSDNQLQYLNHPKHLSSSFKKFKKAKKKKTFLPLAFTQ